MLVVQKKRASQADAYLGPSQKIRYSISAKIVNRLKSLTIFIKKLHRTCLDGF